MSINNALATALEDLTLDPVVSSGDSYEDSLVAGYSLPESGASDLCCSSLWTCCCCSSCFNCSF
jgi:hypothetical protein